MTSIALCDTICTVYPTKEEKMDLHPADYITFAGLIALAGFIYTQIQGVERKIDAVAADLKAVAADVKDLQLDKAKRDGKEEGYAQAKAELQVAK